MSEPGPPAPAVPRAPYLVAALLLLAGSLWLGHEALALRYYTSLGPGAGFFPFWLALLLGLLSAILLGQAMLGRVAAPEEAPRLPSLAGVLRLSTVVGALAGATLLLEPLGFRLVMAPFLLVLLVALGRQPVWLGLLIAVAGAWGGHLLFVRWLGVPLPPGPFGL